MCRYVPLYKWYFLLTRWDTMREHILFYGMGITMLAVGFGLWAMEPDMRAAAEPREAVRRRPVDAPRPGGRPRPSSPPRAATTAPRPDPRPEPSVTSPHPRPIMPRATTARGGGDGLCVLFLEIDTEQTWAVASIGPASMAAYLRRHGHEASGLRVPLDMTVSTLAESIRRADPGLLAVSLTTRQWQRARSVFAELRREVDLPVIAGGLHPTFAPESLLDHGGFDYLCLGEGEQALLDLVEALDRGEGGPALRIDNIWPLGGERPALRPPFAPVDDLPFAARDLLDEPSGLVHMTTQRGCPFPCTYCAAGQYTQLYGRQSAYGRRRSHENVLAELEAIRSKGLLSYIIFLDDTFTIHPVWVADFCRLFGERLGVGFSIHARPDTVDPEMLRALADAGCKHIVFGVESGSPRLRRDVMQRPISNDRMIDAFRWSRDVGLMATANYMLGLPGETRDDIEQTLELHEQLRPFDFGYFVYYPYPGTHLFRVCLERGYLPENYGDLPAHHRSSILRLPGLSADEIADYYDRFTSLREREQVGRLAGYGGEKVEEEVRASVRGCAAKG